MTVRIIKDEEPTGYKITYTFVMPDHHHDHLIFSHAHDYYALIWEIYNKCMLQVDNSQEPSKAVDACQQILQMISDARVFEVV